MASEALIRYEEVVLSKVTDKERRYAMLKNAQAAASENSLYGPFGNYQGVAQMYLDNAASAYGHDELPPALAHLRAEQAAEAIDVVTSNMVLTTEQYLSNRQDFNLADLDQTRADLEDGIIRPNGRSFLPTEHAMTPREGVMQVEHANFRFSGRPSAEQLFIADVNYRGWTSDIMSTGDNMLQGGATLREMIDQDAAAEMAHLRASNMMIGEHVAAAVDRTGNRPITLIDLGAGSGATTVMNAMGLSSSKHEGPLRMVALEGTHAFYKAISEGQLPQDVLNRLRDGGYMVGDSLLENPLNADSAGNESSYGVAYGDMLDCVERLTLTPEQSQGLILVTANYCLHRLPLKIKRKIFEKISKLGRNVIFLMGDLWENASFINRHYFNFGANGPANCGNRGFQTMLTDVGFDVKQLDENNAPSGVNRDLLSSITDSVSNDALFLVATLGDEASRIAADWRES